MKKVSLLIPSLFCCIYALCTLNFSVPVDLPETNSLFSSPTDYFRSVQTGDWDILTTWESSPDNATWSAATLVPNSGANTVSIRAGHTVTFNINLDIDQVVIESGGILIHFGNGMLISDGPGDDIDVKSGGIFTLASASNPPVFFSGLATTNISTGGILRVSAAGLTFPGTGVNASNYIYQDASVLEYTPALAFASAGVTFFPNVNATTIPIFRTTNNVGIVGGTAATTFNGLFEANGNITFQGTGIKTFRNGITGTGNINGSGSGKFLINGTTAKFGGSGTLIVSAANGMDIGGSTTVTMVSNKVMTGNISLLASNALIILDNFNLDITAGNVNGGIATSHVVTNGTGKLIYNFVTATQKIYPVGANTTTINPMAISNGGGFNYGVRVEIGINPPIAVPVNAVNRTWFVTPSGGTPGTVNTNFFYAAGEANAGFNYSANLELGQYTGVWNVIQTGIVPSGSYQVATTVSTFANNIEAPLVLGNLGAILAVDDPVSVNYFTGVKQSGDHLLKWRLTCNNTPSVTMVLERSTDGIQYAAIFSEYATALRCEQPFVYTDDKPAAGINYYRIKMIDVDGKISYSTIVSLINAVKGIDVMNIAPNPIVNGTFNLEVSTAEKIQMELVITDIQGRILQKQSVPMIAGFNSIPMNVRSLSAGTYQLFGSTAYGRSKVLRFAIQ